MQVNVSVRVSGRVALDPEDYFEYQEGSATIQVREVSFTVGQYATEPDKLFFTGGWGYRVLKDGGLGVRRLGVYTDRGLPDRVRRLVLVVVQEEIENASAQVVTL